MVNIHITSGTNPVIRTSCIFSMHLMWVITILHAPTGLRAIASMYVLTLLFGRIIADHGPVANTKSFCMVSWLLIQ